MDHNFGIVPSSEQPRGHQVNLEGSHRMALKVFMLLLVYSQQIVLSSEHPNSGNLVNWKEI